MNQKLSAFVQSIVPPVIFNFYQHRRGRAGRYPWLQFGTTMTCTNSQPLLEGRFADIYAKYYGLDPHTSAEVGRYRVYTVCYFASLCRNVPGDFAGAGISYGVSARVMFDFTDFATLGKTLHLIDPFEGIVSNKSNRVSERYNRDPDRVLRQYPPNAPLELHQKRIPLRLPGKLAFVFSDTGNAAADAEALPIFYEALNPGGIFITNQYANDLGYYEPVLARLGLSPLWLPTGQGVIFKR
jgi:hypothetical protein